MAGSLRRRSGGRNSGASTLENPHCFQFTHISLEGFENVLKRKLEGNAALAEYTLSTSMFSLSQRQFTGRFLDSMPCDLLDSLERGAVVCPIDQVAFFYTQQTDASLLLAIELNASYLSDGTEQHLCLGWTMLVIFDHAVKAAASEEEGVVRLPLYEGSPRMLFSVPQPVIDFSGLVPIPGCILACSLSPHPVLARGSHLFPPNVLVTYGDEIPGLIPTFVHEAFPKVAGCTSGILDKASLLLVPSVDDFERDFLALLEEDLSQGGTTGLNINIEERRMKFACYNGWTFVSPPLIGYLEKVSLTSRTSLFRTTPPSSSSLAFRGSLELNDIIVHTSTEMVLLLEYVVTWKEGDKLHSTTLTVGWGVWLPFESMDIPVEDICVSLDLKVAGGHGFQPPHVPTSAYKLCYQNGLKDIGKVTFKFSPHGATNRPTSSQHSTPAYRGGTQPKTSSAIPSPDHQEGVDVPDNGGESASPDHPPGEGPLSSSVDIEEHEKAVKQEEVRLQQDEEWLQQQEEEEPLKFEKPPVEVKSVPAQNPLAAVVTRSSNSVSRTTLAYLHSTGAQCLFDTNGTPIPTVDLNKVSASLAPPIRISLSSQPHRIAIQLLAFGHSNKELTNRLSSLEVTYQFFSFQRTTTSCQLVEPPDVGGKSLPFIFQTCDGVDQSGLTHTFPVNHTSLPGLTDRQSFQRFMSSGHLQVDLFDGSSHILVGSALIPMKFLLYREECYQVTLSAFVVFPEASTDPAIPCVPMPSLDMGTPVGKLYLRLARLPPESADFSSVSPPEPLSNRISLARKLYDRSAALGNEDEETRQRKLARMQYIRMNEDSSSADSHTPHPEGLTLRGQFTVSGLTSIQDTVVDVQREELRHQRVAAVLEEHISSTYFLRPQMGTAVYFEHQFTNTRTLPLNMTISWRDPELKLVQDRLECHYLRELHSLQTSIDDNLITESQETGQYGFLIHPNETVSLPFKYQTFHVPMRSSQDGEEMECQYEQKIIKVYLQTSHMETLAMLNVHIHPRWHQVDRVFNLYHPQGTFLKKYFELKHLISTEGVAYDGTEVELFATTSNHDNMCEIRHTKEGLPCCFVKSPVKAGPQSSSFFIMVYSQKYAFHPSEIWLVSIHPALRIDHSLTLGQASTVQIGLHGNSVDRRINCYSQSGPVIKVVTPSPFLLVSHTFSTVQVTLKTYSPQKSTIVITAVDLDSKQLVTTWLVCVVVQEPALSRAFKISFPLGGARPDSKSISFTNPYGKMKEFFLYTNRPDYLAFDPSVVKLRPNETGTLVLQFTPSAVPLSLNTLVFINDELDQTEECFLVNAVYS